MALCFHSRPAFALRASARQPSLASPRESGVACRAVAREASDRFHGFVLSFAARLRPAGFGAAAFARFATRVRRGLPSRSSRSERQLSWLCAFIRGPPSPCGLRRGSLRSLRHESPAWLAEP